MYICKFCKKECKNTNSLKNHERLCRENPNRQIIKNGFTEYNRKLKNHEVTRRTGNQFTKARRENRIYVVSETTKNKIREFASKRRHTDIEKQRISSTMKIVARNNPEIYSLSQIHKRTKHYTYNGIRIDGTWELLFLKYLDQLNIRWERCKTPFEYIWNNSTHSYYPDFYLSDYDVFIEVKGYETARDLEKYKVVPNLYVIRKNEIKLIQSNLFNIFQFINTPVAQW